MRKNYYCYIECAEKSRDDDGNLCDELHPLFLVYAADCVERINRMLRRLHRSKGCSGAALAKNLNMPKVKNLAWRVCKTQTQVSPSVNTLKGIITVGTTSALAPEEEKELIEKLNGANDDGFGEVIRQEHFETLYGVGYIRFGRIVSAGEPDGATE